MFFTFATMFSFSLNARRFSLLGTTLAALVLAFAACSKLGDPVLEPDPVVKPGPDDKPPSTTFVPVLSHQNDTTIREGQWIDLRFAIANPDSFPLVYTLQGPGDFEAARWMWRPGTTQAGAHSVRLIVSVQGHPEWADTVAFGVEVLDETQPGPKLSYIADITIREGELMTLLLKAESPRGRNLTYSVKGPPGTVLTGAGFSWRPTYSQAGMHDLVFTVTEEGPDPRSGSQNVRITVLDVDRPPVLQAVRDTTIDTSQTLQLTLKATDPDGDALVYAAFSASGGSLAGASVNGAVFQWKPTAAQQGANTILFMASANGLLDTVSMVVNVRVKPVVPVDTTTLPVTVPAPFSHWRFDEPGGDIASDYEGPLNIPLYGAPARVAGVSGTALRFDGTGAQYGESLQSFPDMTAQTLAAWVYVDTLVLTTVTLIQESNNSSGRDNELSIEKPAGSTTWKFMYRTRDDDGRHFSNASISARKWYYLAATATRDTVRLYINGELDKTVTSPAPFNLSGSHYRIQLARKNDGARVFPFYLSGMLDEVKLFTRALTPQQIQAEWNRHKTAAGY